MSVSRPRILVVDRGSFFTFAQCLAADAEVFFFSEFRNVAAMSKNALVGRDVPGVERVDSMWNVIDDVDVIAFPDVGDGDMQHWLRKQGYAVWGTGKAEMLELDRWQFKQLLKRLDLPIVPTRHVIGLDELEKILIKEDDLYLKTSFFRGDLETFHHVNYDLSRPWLDELRYRLGPHAQEIEVLVEDPVATVELGYDGYCIDGEFPSVASWGLELKDCAYISRSCDAHQMPECIQDTNAALADAMKALGVRGNFASEIRVADDGTAYINDPTFRCPSPPISALSVWISNWVEIVVAGAHGECVDPMFRAEYAAEIELAKINKATGMATYLEHQWMAVDIPDAVEPWVRLRRPVVYDGRYWCIPEAWLDIAGSVVGLGATPEAAIDAALANAEQIQGPQLSYNTNAKQELLDGWSKAQEACKSREGQAA